MNPIKFVLALVALTVFAAIPVVVVADGDGDEDTSYYGNAMRPLIENGGSNIYGPGNARIARTGNNASHETFVNDHLLSARLRLGSASTTRDEYGPFGTPVGTIGLYTGHHYDVHQDLYLTPARIQDPSLGRFLSPDLMRSGANPYHYAGSNPIGYVDPGGDILTPYFMESNTDPAYSYSMARSIMSMFGAPIGMHVAHDHTFGSRVRPGKQSGGLTSIAGKSLRRKLQGNDVVGGVYERTEEFYWIMGGNREVELPNELVPVLDRWSVMQPGAAEPASRIIILDFTGIGTGANNQAKLRSLGRDSLVIEARAINYDYNEHTSGMNPTQYVVNIDGKNRKMGKPEFRMYVQDEITKKWGTSPRRGVEPIRPGVLRNTDLSPPPRKKTPAAGSLPAPTEPEVTATDTLTPGMSAEDFHGVFFDTIPLEGLER